MKITKILEIILVILFILLIVYVIATPKMNALYMKSILLDNKKYSIQNVADKEEAIKILNTIHQNIFIMKKYLGAHINDYPEYVQYIKQFCDKIKDVILLENPPDGKYTSFTINKGKKIYLCLRSKKTGKLHDINLIMYVTIHELAHVACPEINHTDLFKKIFIFLLLIAVKLNLYKDINYQMHPSEYCGLYIKENLLENYNVKN